MIRPQQLLAPLVITTLVFAGCASDEAETPTETPITDAPIDNDVDGGVDTEIEQGENLGFEGDES